MTFYLAQIISIVTTVVVVLTMQFKKMHLILLGQLLGNLLTAVPYFLLNGFSGAAICTLACVQTVVMFILERRQVRVPLWLLLGFVALYLGCAILFYQTPWDIVPAAASLSYALSVAQKKPSVSRAIYVFNPILWMVYDLSCQGYVSFLMHLLILISTVVAMIRIDRIFQKKRTESQE